MKDLLKEIYDVLHSVKQELNEYSQNQWAIDGLMEDILVQLKHRSEEPVGYANPEMLQQLKNGFHIAGITAKQSGFHKIPLYTRPQNKKATICRQKLQELLGPVAKKHNAEFELGSFEIDAIEALVNYYVIGE